MISKNIPLSTLDIDVENGKIWLNGISCILRIQNLNFKQIEEKFSMIEINGNDAYMYPGDSLNKEYSNFLENITTLIYAKILVMSHTEKIDFLDNLINMIKKEIENDNIR